jgi:hypothetical protein
MAFQHEILVELFRSNGALATELLHACAELTVDYVGVELGSIDLTQIASTEYRADAVVILRDHAELPVMGIIVEIQRTLDRSKRFTWPVYVATLRARLECPVILLIVSPYPAVTDWARRSIELGHPGFQLSPIVVDFEDVPRIQNLAEAHALPQLAVLSALAHPDLENATLAINAISRLPLHEYRLYFDVITAALPPALRKLMEDPVIKGYEYQSDIVRKWYGAGLQEAAIEIAELKGVTLTEEERVAVMAVLYPPVIRRLTIDLGLARDATEVRAVLDRALVRPPDTLPSDE